MLLNLRFWLFISFLLHVGALAALTVQFELFKPETPQVLQVQLVSLPQGQPTDTPPKPIEPIITQASAAPREAPENPDRPQQAAEAPKVQVAAKAEEKKVEKKPEEKPKPKPEPEAEQEKEEAKPRPPKLDKTPDKTKAIRSEDPDAKKVARADDDFLRAMDFLEKLEEEELQPKQEEVEPDAGLDEEETILTLDDLKLADREDLIKIQRHIKKQWILPPGLRDADKLTAVVHIRVKEDGSLDSSPRIIQSSGQRFFDNALLRAIRKATPLPIPREKHELFKSIELHFTGD